MSALELGSLSRIIEGLNPNACDSIQQLLEIRKIALGARPKEFSPSEFMESEDSKAGEKRKTTTIKPKKVKIFDRPIARDLEVVQQLKLLTGSDRNSERGRSLVRLVSICLGVIARLKDDVSEETIVQVCDLMRPVPGLLKHVSPEFISALRDAEDPSIEFAATYVGEDYDELNSEGVSEILAKVKSVTKEDESGKPRKRPRPTDDDVDNEEEILGPPLGVNGAGTTVLG